MVVGCTWSKSAYEKSVYELEPVYCYRSLADVSCFRKPDFRDERRLANYYGPAPSKYARPKPPPLAELQPPPPADLDDEAEDEEEGDEGEDVEEAASFFEPEPAPERLPIPPLREASTAAPMLVSARQPF